MKKIIKWIAIILLIGFVIIQFIRIDKAVPEYDKGADFIALNPGNEKGAALLRNACYDCHSYEVKYPWYSEIAPISWLIADHVEEGREHLNFSIWGTYAAGDQAELREESAEEFQEGEMPLSGYVTMHSEAKLSEADKQVLISYLTGGIVMESGGEEEDHD